MVGSSEVELRPFRACVHPQVLEDLAERLASNRWPKPPEGDPWALGTSLAYLTRLSRAWAQEHNWRSWEGRFEGFEQYKASVEGFEIHVLVKRSPVSGALPIVLTHGWPGSIIEFLAVAEMLADPAAAGGDPADAFTVVLPSLPGYGFSDSPDAPFPPAQLARAWHRLMTEGLGFSEYVAHGSDWGAVITSALGLEQPKGLRAIHLTAGAFIAPWSFADQPLDQTELDYISAIEAWERDETGYQSIQGTRPLTLSYALTDSPIGLAAWISEKYRAWTDHEGPDPDIPMDLLIATVMMHWIPGPGPAMWMYRYLTDRSALILPDGLRVETPTGIYAFPKDYGLPPPRAWLERSYNLHDFQVAERGGHFPGLEQPEVLAAAIRAFFRSFRLAQYAA